MDMNGSNIMFSNYFTAKATDKTLQVSFNFTVSRPKLWWTWNIGTPYLYTYTVYILDSKGLIID